MATLQNEQDISSYLVRYDISLLYEDRRLYQIRQYFFLKRHKIFAHIAIAYRGECEAEYNTFAAFDEETDALVVTLVLAGPGS
jgi:hypothetical protein